MVIFHCYVSSPEGRYVPYVFVADDPALSDRSEFLVGPGSSDPGFLFEVTLVIAWS